MNANTPDRLRGISRDEARPLSGISNQELVFHLWDWKNDVQSWTRTPPYRYPTNPGRNFGRLRSKIKTIRSYGNYWGVPVYLSETGISRYHPDAAAFLMDVCSLCDTYNIHLTLHAYREAQVWNYEANAAAWMVVTAWMSQ